MARRRKPAAPARKVSKSTTQPARAGTLPTIAAKPIQTSINAFFNPPTTEETDETDESEDAKSQPDATDQESQQPDVVAEPEPRNAAENLTSSTAEAAADSSSSAPTTPSDERDAQDEQEAGPSSATRSRTKKQPSQVLPTAITAANSEEPQAAEESEEPEQENASYGVITRSRARRSQNMATDRSSTFIDDYVEQMLEYSAKDSDPDWE